MMQDWTPELTMEALRGAVGDPLLLSYDIEYPRLLSLRPAAQRVNSFCAARARAAEHFACTAVLAEARRQQSALGDSFEPLEISGSTQVMRNGGGLLSGFTDGYRRMGARGARLTRLSRTFDLQTGREVPLPELFRQGVPWRERIFSLLDEELYIRQRAEPGAYYRTAASICRKKLFGHSYYLADDGLAIWFPQETIAPGNTGIPTVLVRYDTLRGLLRRQL